MTPTTRFGTRRLDRVDLATAGLFFSWLAHDLEEYLTMPGRPHPFTGLPARSKRPHTGGPDRWFWRSGSHRLTRTSAAVQTGRPLSRDQVYVALSLVGLLMAAASIDGYRTRGRSGFYQSVLFGYGMHAGIHLASAALARGYTSGSVTALPVVLPFWLFARRALQADGVELRPRWWTLVAFPVLGLGVHSFGAWVARRWEAGS